jgi:hypothetical protein
LVSVDAQIKKRREESAKLEELCHETLRSPDADISSLDIVMQALQELMEQDGVFLNAQIRLYKKDFQISTAELVNMQKKQEEQTKDGN